MSDLIKILLCNNNHSSRESNHTMYNLTLLDIKEKEYFAWGYYI